MSSSNNNQSMDDLKARLGMKGAGTPSGSVPSAPVPGSKGPARGAAPSPFGGGASPFAGAAGGGAFGAPVEQEEEERYDYVAPAVDTLDYDPNQFDADLKAPINKGKLGVLGGVAFIIIVLSFFIGWFSSSISTDRASVNRRIDMAILVEKTVNSKVEAFNEYSAAYRDRATQFGGKARDFDQKFFDTVIKGYSKHAFALDTSSDIPAEAIILGQNANQNPLSEIRAYSAGSMLLIQLLSNHVAETNADIEEIHNLLNIGEGQAEAAPNTGVYAVRFNVDTYVAFLESAGRGNYAIDSRGIYQVKRPIMNEEEIVKVWNEMKTGLTQVQIQQLTQGGTKKKGEESDGLPNRMIYEIQARGARPVYVFSDEIILVNRDQLLGSSSNALDRYSKRMQQIYTVMEETSKVTESLQKKLYSQSHEEKL